MHGDYATIMRFSLLLLASVALALMATGDTDASKEPEWNYSIDGNNSSLNLVSISTNGEYIAAGTYNYNNSKVYLFNKDSSTPLWNYTTENSVRSVDISADGEYIVAGTLDNKTYLFDKDSNTPLWNYTAGNIVVSVSISADGEYIAAGSYDNKVYLFSKDNSTPLWNYTTEDYVFSVEISADGEYIVVGSGDDNIYLFDRNNSTPLWNYTTKWDTESVAISADGEYIAMEGETEEGRSHVYLFNKDNNTPLWDFWDDAWNSVNSVAISADGEYITVGSGHSGDGGRVYLFDKDSSTPLWSYAASDKIRRIAISADGEYIVADSNGNKFYLFDKDSGTPLWNYTTENSVNSVDISADGEYIVAGIYRSGVYLLDNVNNSAPLWSYEAGSAAYSVAISADGEHIAAGSDDNKVYLFSKESSTPLWNYTTGDVRSVAISANGKYIAAGSTNGDKIYLFDKDSSTPLWSYETGSAAYSVAISADGEYIAAGSFDNKVYLFNKDSSTPLWSYETGNVVRSVSISANGEHIAAGSDDNKVYLFSKESSTPLWNYTTGDWVYSVAISANGEYIVAGTAQSDDKVYLFDKDSSTPLWNYTTEADVYSVAISADGEYITAGSFNLYLFSKESSTPLWNYTTGSYVYSVAISADGEYITAGAYLEKKIFLFDKDSDMPLWSSTTEHEVRTVAISADSTNGKYIVTGTTNRKVYLFDNHIPPTAKIQVINSNIARFDAEITFSGSGSDSDGSIVAYEWTSDIDGFLSNEKYFNSTGFTIGNHTISFRVQDNDGYWSEWVVEMLTIYPNTPPVGTIDYITSSPARFDAEIAFSGSGSDSDGAIVAYEWTSHIDGFLSSEKDFNSTGFTVGNHTISFRVQDNDGGWSEWGNATLIVYLNAPPVATSDSDGGHARFDDVIIFNGSGSDSDGSIVAYEWVSDIDGFLSDEKDFNSTGFTVGNHTISFRVQDNDGYWSEWDDIQLVISNIPPVGTLNPSNPTSVPKGANRTLSGSGIDADGAVVNYRWISSIDGYINESNDSSQVSTSTLSFGSHTITFQVQDNNGGWSESVSQTLLVGAYPVALANHWNDDNSPQSNMPVQFRGSASDEDGNIVFYEWDFNGDGEYEWSSADSGNASYTYVKSGIYTVVLRVTDNDGLTSTDTRVITISKAGNDDGEGNDGGGGIPPLSVILTIFAWVSLANIVIAVIALRLRPK